ncbi:MAG: tetratricopeptide repeat protein [Spirochaetaceae bacterium]|jgi:tetratricopeptide (TPR) repeat protein|nr:tetratricopeptide repeat protein [Spirochaetaceae bacterium]
MFVPIILIITLFLAGSVTAYIMLNKAKKKERGLLAPDGKKGKKGANAKSLNNDTAVELALKRLEKNPQDTEALLVLAEKYYNQQNWEKAFKTYETLCISSSGRPGVDYFEIHLRCGQAAVNDGRLDEAFKNFVVAASFNNSDYRVHFELGNLSFLNGNYEKAVTHLTKARTLNPEHAPSLCVLGHAYFKLKKYKEAMVNIRKALDLVPGDKETLFTLAECYEESGQTDQATRIYCHLRADPEWGPASCLAVGMIYSSTQRLDEAAVNFSIGLQHNNIKTAIALELRYQLAMVYLKKNDISNALAHLNTINNERPDYKNTATLIQQYTEMYSNRNLQTYIMSQPDEFLGLCRKIVISFFSKAKVKIMQTNMTSRDWADILAQVDTPRWSSIIGFRFFRTQGNIGELVIRDFHAYLRNVKADKGVCFGFGLFTDDAKRFTEARLIDLVDKPRLTALLGNVDSVTQPMPKR